MGKYELVCHPDTPCRALDHLVVEASRADAGLLRLWFVMTGEIDAIALPASGLQERRDGLWRTTCLEAFVMAPGTDAYVEYNLSPASHWAAYRFSAYREGIQELDVGPPKISTASLGRSFAVGADLELPAACSDLAMRMALSAVIEERGGTKSYWALSHPPGAPDFHHPTCFAATLPAPSRP